MADPEVDVVSVALEVSETSKPGGLDGWSGSTNICLTGGHYDVFHSLGRAILLRHLIVYIWHSPGHPHPPPPGDGHGSLPRPLWEWVGWLWMGGNAG